MARGIWQRRELSYVRVRHFVRAAAGLAASAHRDRVVTSRQVPGTSAQGSRAVIEETDMLVHHAGSSSIMPLGFLSPSAALPRHVSRGSEVKNVPFFFQIKPYSVG